MDISSLISAILATVIGGLILHYLCKWLDSILNK